MRGLRLLIIAPFAKVWGDYPVKVRFEIVSKLTRSLNTAGKPGSISTCAPGWTGSNPRKKRIGEGWCAANRKVLSDGAIRAPSDGPNPVGISRD